MGESDRDRIGLLHQLAILDPHPESVPINMLVAVEGTPLASRPSEDPLEVVRMIATARILMPASIVRLSAGRSALADGPVCTTFLWCTMFSAGSATNASPTYSRGKALPR